MLYAIQINMQLLYNEAGQSGTGILAMRMTLNLKRKQSGYIFSRGRYDPFVIYREC